MTKSANDNMMTRSVYAIISALNSTNIGGYIYKPSTFTSADLSKAFVDYYDVQDINNFLAV